MLIQQSIKLDKNIGISGDIFCPGILVALNFTKNYDIQTITDTKFLITTPY
jgi:hypothetical protein